MKKVLFVPIVICVFIMAAGDTAYSQSWLNKLKEKTQDKLIDKVVGEEEDTHSGGNYEDSEIPDEESRIRNTRGEGITSTPPDVAKNLGNADNAFKEKRYGEARYSIRRAVMAIEMKMGQEMLEELPEKVGDLPKVPEDDRVTCKRTGLDGLTIERVYRLDDQQLKISIGNDAAMLTAAGIIFSGDVYAEDEGRKRVQFQDHRAVIQFDEYSGYQLSVPFGQSSIMLVEGINYTTEKDFMTAAEHFDMEIIKNKLGEQ